MNTESIIIFTKDALPLDYLPCYGNKYWEGKTPNLDELVNKGTLFTNFYTAAPSSAMAYLAMFTGKFPYEQNIERYSILNNYKGDTLFDKAYKKGFSCHVIWDESWMPTSYLRSMCYGEHTTIHPLKNLHQGVGFHYNHNGRLKPDKQKEIETLKMIEQELVSITQNESKVFLWFHLPHVINGRVGYGSDIDVYDNILGIVRKFFDDSHIFISADHGNMNGQDGKLGYGFDVKEPAIHIPLITPIKQNLRICTDLVSNIDWEKLVFDKEIPSRDVVISDTAYYCQPNRKTAIIYGNYRYIYNKLDGTEELYDISWDPNEKFNLILDQMLDVDRNKMINSCELYFYPKWSELPTVRSFMREQKNKMWREGTRRQELISKNKFVFATKNPKLTSVIRKLLGK